MSHIITSVAPKAEGNPTVGRTAWDLLHTLAKSRAFVVGVVLSLLMILSAAAGGFVRFGFRDGFFLEVGPSSAAEAVGAGGITFTHEVASTCRNNHTKAEGINLRSGPLEGAALVAAQRSDMASADSLVAWLDNGAPVVVLKTTASWHHVVAMADGRPLVGYLSASCSGQPTLAAIVKARK